MAEGMGHGDSKAHLPVYNSWRSDRGSRPGRVASCLDVAGQLTLPRGVREGIGARDASVAVSAQRIKLNRTPYAYGLENQRIPREFVNLKEISKHKYGVRIFCSLADWKNVRHGERRTRNSRVPARFETAPGAATKEEKRQKTGPFCRESAICRTLPKDHAG